MDCEHAIFSRFNLASREEHMESFSFLTNKNLDLGEIIFKGKVCLKLKFS